MSTSSLTELATQPGLYGGKATPHEDKGTHRLSDLDGLSDGRGGKDAESGEGSGELHLVGDVCLVGFVVGCRESGEVAL